MSDSTIKLPPTYSFKDWEVFSRTLNQQHLQSGTLGDPSKYYKENELLDLDPLRSIGSLEENPLLDLPALLTHHQFESENVRLRQMDAKQDLA
jgi:hypothetical protein